MSEWFKELVLKTSDSERNRGFESHLLRQRRVAADKRALFMGARFFVVLPAFEQYLFHMALTNKKDLSFAESFFNKIIQVLTRLSFCDILIS